MMRLLLISIAAWNLTAAAADVTQHSITLSAAQQSRLGVMTLPLSAYETTQTLTAIARVLDVGPLAQLDADIASARAKARASAQISAQLEQLVAANQAASRQEFETARAQAVADREQSRLLERRLALEWGPDIATWSSAKREALLADIAANRTSLLRVDAPGHDALAAAGVSLKMPDQKPIPATHMLGTAAGVDPDMQTIGALALVAGTQARSLRPGLLVEAELDTGQRLTGVLLPDAALVRVAGASWAYVQTGPESFQRRLVSNDHILPAGRLVTDGFTAGEQVVASGAGALLAVEYAAATNPGD